MHALAGGRILAGGLKHSMTESLSETQNSRRPSLAATSLTFIHLYKTQTNRARTLNTFAAEKQRNYRLELTGLPSRSGQSRSLNTSCWRTEHNRTSVSKADANAARL